MTKPGNVSLRTLYAQMPESEPPTPWQRVSGYISGVTAVGFGSRSEMLLVMSHDGMGIVDCLTGNIVDRIYSEQDRFGDEYPISAEGFGPLAGEGVSLAGLWGGGLRTTTPDGWVVHRIAPNWPRECVVLCPPDAPEVDDDPTRVAMLLKDSDPGVRAIGFSDSGQSLVVATTQLFIWGRIAKDRIQP